MTVEPRRRARDLGIAPGVLPPGPRNALTDVAGVAVGHATLAAGDRLRTGVTAILPHGGNPFAERVPAAVHVGNGFGKLVGATQVNELGELETPILLTGTLSAWRAADALVEWLLEQPGMDGVRSLNPLVGECNDGRLSDIRARPIGPAEVRAALAAAATGAVAEGSVGAGTGCMAFGWKGGIGTASRVLPETAGGWTVGVLVQANFGGDLMVLGVPVGRLLRAGASGGGPRADGSCMVVLATDAPLGHRNLMRLAGRAPLGLARTGSWMANGSGDYGVAFSTAAAARRPVTLGPHGAGTPPVRTLADVGNDGMSGLFQAAVEATEEAVYNALFTATPVGSAIGSAAAIPLDRVAALLREGGSVSG